MFFKSSSEPSIAPVVAQAKGKTLSTPFYRYRSPWRNYTAHLRYSGAQWWNAMKNQNLSPIEHFLAQLIFWPMSLIFALTEDLKNMSRTHAQHQVFKGYSFFYQTYAHLINTQTPVCYENSANPQEKIIFLQNQIWIKQSSAEDILYIPSAEELLCRIECCLLPESFNLYSQRLSAHIREYLPRPENKKHLEEEQMIIRPYKKSIAKNHFIFKPLRPVELTSEVLNTFQSHSLQVLDFLFSLTSNTRGLPILNFPAPLHAYFMFEQNSQPTPNAAKALLEKAALELVEIPTASGVPNYKKKISKI